ncbi:MAG: stage II sporulation protein M [Methanosphaera stadtmanae]|nr:stage II sporulation protein M [Methanosphaera stadtmanae]
MTLNITEIFGKRYLKEYFSRNKVYILISVFILIASAVLGVIFSDIIKEFVIEILENIVLSMPENPTVYNEATFLFQNNIRANIIIMLGGLFFSIFSILAIIMNGLIIGFTYTIVTPLQFIVGILPHGIFELPATVLSLVGAFLITKLEINLLDALFKKQLKEEIGKSNEIIKDIVLTFIIILILLIIAAIIEAGVTPVLLSMVS